jgi:hypothetical protein
MIFVMVQIPSGFSLAPGIIMGHRAHAEARSIDRRIWIIVDDTETSRRSVKLDFEERSFKPIDDVPLEIERLPEEGSRGFYTTPDGRTRLEPVIDGEVSLLGRLFERFGFSSARQQLIGRLFDVHTHRVIGEIRSQGLPLGSDFGRLPSMNVRWSADGKLGAVHESGTHEFSIWDIPPRKSLTWFAAGAAILALPIAFVAWRRTRKLRAA